MRWCVLRVAGTQSGAEEALVDADPRRPGLHRVFGLADKEGLPCALAREERLLGGRLQATGIDDLRVVASGPRAALWSGPTCHSWMVRSAEAEARRMPSGEKAAVERGQ